MLSMKTYYGIVGQGGYGREIMPIARAALQKELLTGLVELVFVVVDDLECQQNVNGCYVMLQSEFLDLPQTKYFSVAIGNPHIRGKVVASFLEAGATPFTIKADNVVIMDSNKVGDGAILSHFSTITSNVEIGSYFHANLYSYVAHDCVIGDYVTFAPSVKCNGNVVIEDYVYIGTGAVIMQGKEGKPLIIGHGSIVGMGAVVTKNVPPGSTVFGNPARPLTKAGLQK